jgi:Mor family transcriptional regulator
MRYVRAQDIIPAELLALIQQYVDGEYIYIPRKEACKRAWGENSRCKDEIARRNASIYLDHCAGADVASLSASYFLSDKSIRRILLEQRRSICNVT